MLCFIIQLLPLWKYGYVFDQVKEKSKWRSWLFEKKSTGYTAMQNEY